MCLREYGAIERALCVIEEYALREVRLKRELPGGRRYGPAVKILLTNAEDRGGSCLFVAINVALETHSKIDGLSQPMSQREGFSYIEVRALRSAHPGPYTLAMIPKKETPVGRLMRKEPDLGYPSS